MLRATILHNIRNIFLHQPIRIPLRPIIRQTPDLFRLNLRPHHLQFNRANPSPHRRYISDQRLH